MSLPRDSYQFVTRIDMTHIDMSLPRDSYQFVTHIDMSLPRDSYQFVTRIDMTHIDMSLDVESEAELVLHYLYCPQILRDFTTRYADFI